VRQERIVGIADRVDAEDRCTDAVLKIKDFLLVEQRSDIAPRLDEECAGASADQGRRDEKKAG
jgi:hypothetical protein